jgi:prevent-host-death family protein
MAEGRVGTHEAKTRLSEYLNRVHYRGERIVIERHGKPVAALVGMEDLARLESSSENVEERYRKVLAEAGIKVSWSRGVGEPPKRVPRERRRIEVKGIPVSEQLIADRR